MAETYLYRYILNINQEKKIYTLEISLKNVNISFEIKEINKPKEKYYGSLGLEQFRLVCEAFNETKTIKEAFILIKDAIERNRIFLSEYKESKEILITFNIISLKKNNYHSLEILLPIDPHEKDKNDITKSASHPHGPQMVNGEKYNIIPKEIKSSHNQIKRNFTQSSSSFKSDKNSTLSFEFNNSKNQNNCSVNFYNRQNTLGNPSEKINVLRRGVEPKKIRISQKINLEKKDHKIKKPKENEKRIEEQQQFPKGEQYYTLIKDININYENKKGNSRVEPIEIFFTLFDVYQPYNKYSFDVSIINSNKIGNTTFLGRLEKKSGNIIEFGTSFKIDYFFQREQTIIVTPNINGEVAGEGIKYHVSELMKSQDNKLSKYIKNIGNLQISYSPFKNQNNLLSNEISVFEFLILLNNKYLFDGKYKIYDCFYVISNFKDGRKRAVYKSGEYNFEINKYNKTESKSFVSDILCTNKSDCISFDLYCPSIDKNNDIGFSFFNLKDLNENLEADKQLSVKIENKKYGIIGELQINYNTKEKMDFQKFIKKGQINLDIAIDYTKSNGDPHDPDSLHYLDGKENDYEKAIKSCGKIIAYYDSDQIFPVYGFGGIPQGKDKVSHCFNITFKDDPNIKGLDKIIDYYKESLTKVKFSYPTCFSYIIKKVIDEINYDFKNRQKENHYYILMILTDGDINDTQDSIDSIVEASNLPLSIVIIGIGENKNNFTRMEILDGDEKPLTDSSGKIRKRDIVQFVEFNRFKDKVNCGQELAEEVLKEIPRQIEEYYMFCGKFYE